MLTYPVNLLLQGKHCLIVGGGRVALRKLNALLPSGARITVVAPEISDAIRQTAENTDIELKEREYTVEDLQDTALVYLATNDRTLNRQILEQAQTSGILACCTDANWRDSSFITPAKINCRDITIAVSSHGVACRKTKLIKDNLARHIDAIENTALLVLGTDHNLLELDRREPVHLTQDKLDAAGRKLTTLWGVHEFMLLNTCNRIELVAAVQLDNTLIDMLKMIIGLDKLPDDAFYLKTGFEAFSHLCLMTAGLYSQNPGENHITAQFKDALAAACEKQWANSLLSAVSGSVLHVAKHIRNEAMSALKTCETEELALACLTNRIPDLRDKQVLLAGTGVIGRNMLKLLSDTGCRIDWLYNSRRPTTADADVNLLPLTELYSRMPNADIIITALAAADPIITGKNAGLIKPGTEIIDLGAPRNVSPELADNGNRFRVSDLETLKQLQSKNHHGIADALHHADRIIEEHKDIYEQFEKSFIDGHQGQ